MKKVTKLFMNIMAAFIIFAMLAPATSVKAETTAPKTYTVTFRAGNVGRFQLDENRIDSNNMEVTENYVKFTVEKGESLSSTFDFISDDASLDAFFLNLTADIDSGYRLKNASSWCAGAATATVNRNTEYILDYAKLVNPVKYVIRFVDAKSGEQIAPPTIAYGDDGEEIICTPLSVASYQTGDEAVSIVLNAQDETANTVTFQYTYTGEVGTTVQTVTAYEPGDTIVETVLNEIPEAQPAGAAVVATPNEGGEEEGNRTIEDEEVPLANENAQNEEPEDELMNIEDEEVPLAAEKEQMTPPYWVAIAGGTFAVVGLTAVVAFLIKRKKAVPVEGSSSNKK